MNDVLIETYCKKLLDCLINDSMTNDILVKNFDLKMLSYYGHEDI